MSVESVHNTNGMQQNTDGTLGSIPRAVRADSVSLIETAICDQNRLEPMEFLLGDKS